MEKKVRREIGRRLRLVRVAADMTQQEVADSLRPPLKRQTVSAWECGEYLPTTIQLYYLFQRLGASADYVFFGMETIPVGGTMLEHIFRSRRVAEVDQPPRY